MRMVVTGREGQVVRSLIERSAGTDFEVVPIGRPDFDLAGPAELIRRAIADCRPDVVVSAAAYTQVDQAETHAELAFAVNEAGPRAVAQAACEVGAPMIHLSTDYVFDGEKSAPYVEEDQTGPTGVYGASKLAGERAVLSEHPNSAILRTAWVYSPFGANFIKTMLRLAHDRDEIGVVSDQRGNPTGALQIADGVLQVAANLLSTPDPSRFGVFHMTGGGEASWAEFADAIFDVSREMNGPSAQVRRISTADYPTTAKRPANSRLNSGKIAGAHGVRLPEWRQSMREVVERLLRP